MRFGRLLGRYIERRHYLRPLAVGAVVGAVSGIFLGYYLVAAIHPGILGTLAIAFLSFVFGMVVAAVTAFLFFYAQLYRMTKMVAQNCPSCGNELPREAAFCPYCGNMVKR